MAYVENALHVRRIPFKLIHNRTLPQTLAVFLASSCFLLKLTVLFVTVRFPPQTIIKYSALPSSLAIL